MAFILLNRWNCCLRGEACCSTGSDTVICLHTAPYSGICGLINIHINQYLTAIFAHINTFFSLGHYLECLIIQYVLCNVGKA